MTDRDQGEQLSTAAALSTMVEPRSSNKAAAVPQTLARESSRSSYPDCTTIITQSPAILGAVARYVVSPISPIYEPPLINIHTGMIDRDQAEQMSTSAPLSTLPVPQTEVKQTLSKADHLSSRALGEEAARAEHASRPSRESQAEPWSRPGVPGSTGHNCTTTITQSPATHGAVARYVVSPVSPIYEPSLNTIHTGMTDRDQAEQLPTSAPLSKMPVLQTDVKAQTDTQALPHSSECDLQWNTLFASWEKTDKMVQDLIADGKGDPQAHQEFLKAGKEEMQDLKRKVEEIDERKNCHRPSCMADRMNLTEITKKNLKTIFSRLEQHPQAPDTKPTKQKTPKLKCLKETQKKTLQE